MRALWLSFCLMLPLFAQEGPKYYRLDFTVKEFDDAKMTLSRVYSGIATTDERSRNMSVRMGNKVPYSTGGGNFQFVDMGVNIDVQRVMELTGNLVVTVVVEITSTPNNLDAPTPTLSAPVIRSNRWNGSSLIPVGKQTLLFSSDDLHSKRKMQLEVLATPIVPAAK